MTDRATRALSFGAAADQYDALRPTYPPAAVSWALGHTPLRVADLGAGTGILTRVLIALGHDVVPVEPDPGMRDRFERASPGATVRAGSAEAIPLEDGSVDAVVAGQAYHWFDRELAHPEIARVLRPGGVFAPIWNIRDEREIWVAELSEIANLADLHRSTDRELRDAGAGHRFGPVEREVFPHRVPMTADSLAGMIATRSYYLTADALTRAEVDARLRDLAAGLPQVFDMPYNTVVYRTHRLPE